MPICDRCGETIEFRYVGGQPTPIHLNGNWCAGARGQHQANGSSWFGTSGWFDTSDSYTAPNASCPVCGAKVFFYQNSHGSRVYFDDLGWPWPKHGCTDNPIAQSARVKRVTLRRKNKGRIPSRSMVTPYQLIELSEHNEEISLKFRNLNNRLITRTLEINSDILNNQNITVEDLYDTPSFIIKRYLQGYVIEFISIRHGRIARLKMF